MGSMSSLGHRDLHLIFGLRILVTISFHNLFHKKARYRVIVLRSEKEQAENRGN